MFWPVTFSPVLQAIFQFLLFSGRWDNIDSQFERQTGISTAKCDKIGVNNNFQDVFFTRFIHIASDILYYLVTSTTAAFFICSIADFPIINIKNRLLNYLV